MKIPAVATIVSLLSLPGAFANVRRRKLSSKADKISVPHPPDIPGVAQDDTPKVLIGANFYPPNNDNYYFDRRELHGEERNEWNDIDTARSHDDEDELDPQLIVDLFKGLEEVCDIDIVLSHWSYFAYRYDYNSLYRGDYHALGLSDKYQAMYGFPPESFELSAPIGSTSVAILTRLDGGNPVIDSIDSFDDINIAATGYGPPRYGEDFEYPTNPCTGEKSSRSFMNDLEGDYWTEVVPSLINGDVDGLVIAVNDYIDLCDYFCPMYAGSGGGRRLDHLTRTEHCVICDELGTNYTFVHTGITLDTSPMMMSKMGSRLSKTVDPCINAFVETDWYAELCPVVYGLGFCFVGDTELTTPTNELTTNCSDGFCPCSVIEV